MTALGVKFWERVHSTLLLGPGLCLLATACANHTATGATRSYWTKEAYERAEPRLKRARIGMKFDDFTTLVDMKLVLTGGNVTAVLADGWLTPATESWTIGRTKVNEYIFGYVDGVNVVKKVVARFQDNALASIRFFESKGLSDFSHAERQTFTEANVEFLYSRDSYSKAAERAKSLEPGMDYHTFEQVMSLTTVLGRDGRFYFLGQGLLLELAEQGRPNVDGPHRLRRVYFGYRDSNRPVPKIAIDFEDGKISAVHWLQ